MTMIRRRRPAREIAFSFDSFLDVVTNVVGIILRLIIIAWVGARSYKSLQPALPAPPPVLEESLELPDPSDPLAPELKRRRRELAEAQARLLIELRRHEQLHHQGALAAQEVLGLASRREKLEAERAALERAARGHGRDAQTLALSMGELQERTRKVLEEIEALRRAPSLKQTLRYKTPVSQPLQTEELMFECRGGRVTLIDVGSFMDEIHRSLADHQKDLELQGQYSGDTAPAGAFRLHYVVEREAGPDLRSMVSCSWEAQPLVSPRGETAEAALAPGSAFRRVIDNLEPSQTAVTMWVYADSFPLYRRLRDYLHERDVVVAGRPLLDGMPIASSRRGTASRGQ